MVIILVIIFLVAYFNTILIDISQFTGRFSEFGWMEDVRIFKALIALNMLSDSLPNFLFGVSNNIISTTTLNGYTWSDNSFFLVALHFGIIGFLVWCWSLIVIFPWNMDSTKLIYISWIISSFMITNSIIWDTYIICTIFFLLSERDKASGLS